MILKKKDGIGEAKSWGRLQQEGTGRGSEHATWERSGSKAGQVGERKPCRTEKSRQRNSTVCQSKGETLRLTSDPLPSVPQSRLSMRHRSQSSLVGDESYWTFPNPLKTAQTGHFAKPVTTTKTCFLKHSECHSTVQIYVRYNEFLLSVSCCPFHLIQSTVIKIFNDVQPATFEPLPTQT